MGKSSGSSGGNDPSDNKHEQKLQAVLLADTFSNSFHPITLEDYSGSLPTSSSNATDGHVKGRERPLALCPLNNVPLLHHTIDFFCVLTNTTIGIVSFRLPALSAQTN